ncbi:MAG: cell envelope biogenesis protein OmpA [Bacteroidota bacterium]
MAVDKKHKAAEEHDLMSQLRELLFEEEREKQQTLITEVKTVRKELDTREKLEPKVEPIIQDHLDKLKRDFPTLFGPVITETIKYQIKNSQDEVVDALYPIIGKLIKKYITREIEILSERVDQQLENAFSWEGWVNRIKAWFTGTKETDIIMQGLAEPVIEEIFVIEQYSGLLYGTYSRTNTMDQDMIAGMLTAIKSFVVDAFKEGEQDLESIEYESYHILFRSFKTYFLAVAVSGTITASFKDRLDKTAMEFAEKLKNQADKMNEEEGIYSGYLEEYFKESDNDK